MKENRAQRALREASREAVTRFEGEVPAIAVGVTPSHDELRTMRIVTDYEGVEPQLEADIPLSEDPMIGPNTRRVRSLLRGLDEWVDHVVSRSG